MASLFQAAASRPAAHAGISELARLALSEMVPYHDYFCVIPGDAKRKKRERVQSYRKPQTGDLPLLGESAFGFTFEGRFCPCEQRARLTPAERQWLCDQFRERVERDRAERRAKGVDVATILSMRPGGLGVVAITKRKREEEEASTEAKKPKPSPAADAAAKPSIAQWFRKGR